MLRQIFWAALGAAGAVLVLEWLETIRPARLVGEPEKIPVAQEAEEEALVGVVSLGVRARGHASTGRPATTVSGDQAA